MRIIGGIHGGRKFHPPARIPARPTTDFAKEGLFNTLNNMISFEGLKTLDIFAGTGSISYELASRGATDLTLIERDRTTVQFINKTMEELKFDGFKILQMNVFKFLNNCVESYDFIFAGPPYALKEIDKIPDIIFDKKLLNPEGIFILEHTPRNDYQEHPQFLKMKNYGTTIFTYFTWNNN
ncbi:MAG TPA: RsmD family RNA methyltransferase [Chitinophagaceae bacterium]|nr:RsmD family RNA methyltransferase [Chitinophagaceae bacterium]